MGVYCPENQMGQSIHTRWDIGYIQAQVTILSSNILNEIQIHAQVVTSLPINFITSQGLVLFSASFILSWQQSQVDLTLFLLKTLFLSIWFRVMHKRVCESPF